MIDIYDVYCQPRKDPIHTPTGQPWTVGTAVGAWTFAPMSETFTVLDGGQTAVRPIVVVNLSDKFGKPLAQYVLPATEALALALGFETAATTRGGTP